jgi:six-Cys-in-45 modification radical SAM protein
LDLANWHSFQALNRFFLFDVPSNSLFQIEKEVHQYLNSRANANAESLPQSIVAQVESELQELREMGYLREQSEEIPQLQREPSLKAICLHASHDCNLRCKYCFAGTGPFGGDREHMSYDIGRQAIDLLLRESGSHRQLEVDFFGGEPLLNLEVVKQIVDYGKAAAQKWDKKINFTLTTNGIELDNRARQFLNGQQIALVLSLDGRPAVNDKMRGQGTYERIVPNILETVKSRDGKNYYLRGTYTANNLDFTEDVKHLYDLGLRELSLEPVVEKDGDYRLTEAHMTRVELEYDKLAEYYRQKKQAGAGFTFFHFEISLEHGPCLPKRLTGCGAGFDYFAVTPKGDLYPCHQFVGRNGFGMGNVTDGIINQKLRQEFGAATLFKKEGCADCWARYYCSGGCHANAQLINGSIYKPDPIGCRLQRKRLECALALKGIEIEEKQ